MLVESDKEDMTSGYGCMDGCVFKPKNGTGRFCFMTGELPVTCLDDHDFHRCYEGDCGPSHWGDHIEACNGLSQSPIDIVSTGASVQSEPFPFSASRTMTRSGLTS
eukprot:TRINITY_DN15784_c0_g1_i1.p1 TRINITY_DN15784_c0_g1~~TRINITY_DN15784_c0_g1_i1.p1  ORF type:complete len:106 (-),score=12.41 TRINITY_DN15784_c0_g1_i1:5-322(-)